MKRRSALFALTATFAAGLLLFSSAQGQGGSEPPSEDPGRPEGTNDCIERTNRIDCVESVLEVIAKDSTNCLADVGSRIVFDFEVDGYSVDEIEHTFINACPNKTNYTERVTNAVDVVWTITGGQGGVIASGSELPVELSYTNLWPGIYTAKLTASVCSGTVTNTASASVYVIKTFVAGGPYIGINATDTPMGKDGLGRTNLTGFAAFTLPSIPNAPNQIFTFTLASPAGCVFTNGASVIAVPAVDGMVSTSVYENDKESAAVTNEVITVADPYGGCLASNRFTVVRVDVSMEDLPAAEEESTGAFIPWNIDRDWVAGSSDSNAFANILDYQTNHFANADDDLRRVFISVFPNDLPPTEEVELTGYEYLWEDQTKTRPATNVYTLATLSNTTFWIEGRAISGTLTNMSITATHKLSGATDRVNYTVVGLAVEHPKYLGIDATGETGPPGKDDAIEIKGKLMPIGVPQGSGDIEYEIVQSNAGCTFNPAVGAIALLHEADKPSNTGEWETFKISCPTGTALPIISSVRVVRVEVELRAQAEDKEETPGAFIGYNGDDDNYSMAEDRRETNVTGEDDLVECKISILPDDLTDNETIELSGDVANVWQTRQKDTLAPTEFSIGELRGLQFWIEGHDSYVETAGQTIRARHHLSRAEDRIQYAVMKVDLFRDDSCTKSLDDWPAEPGKIRSPRFIFGKDDNIFIQVIGPTGLGNNYFDVQVTSEADSIGVPIKLQEVSSGIYRNTELDGEILRLGTASSQGAPADFIKVIEDEILTFSLMESGAVVCEKGAMVDRGEYSACGITIFFGGGTSGDGEQLKQEFGYSRVNFWEAGYQEFANNVGSTGTGNAMESFIKNAGGNTGDNGEGDFLYASCHGSADGNLIDEDGGRLIFKPSNGANGIQNGNDWNNDVEWIWIGACSWLDDNLGNHSGDGRAKWQESLFGIPRPAHGLLGYCEPSPGSQWDIEDDFFDHAAASSPETIVNAYISANAGYIYGYYPYAILCHKDNETDCLKEVTRDTSSTEMKYWWYESSSENGSRIYTRGTSDSTTPANESNVKGKAAFLKVKRMEMPEFREIKKYSKTDYECGRVVLTRNKMDFSKLKNKLEDQVAKAILANHIRKNMKELPADAVLLRTGSMNVATFNWNDPIEKWSKQKVGETFEFGHAFQGIPIEGDHIAFIVVDGDVVQIKWNWHSIEKEEGPAHLRPIDPSAVLSTMQGIADHKSIKQKPLSVDPVYYAFRTGAGLDEIRLVWKLSFRDGMPVYVDVTSGQTMETESDWKAANKKTGVAK